MLDKKTTGIRKIEHPDRVLSYFKPEKKVLLLIAIGGIGFNGGMIAGPYFEGRLAQCLYECIQGQADGRDMLRLAGVYLSVILFVQLMRTLKRFSGARLRNDLSRNMRHMLYNGIVHMSREEVAQENIGAIMTKAVADVDASAQGMQQVTTEIFDTGVLLGSYLGMLLVYDWKLTLLACLFLPVAYGIALSLKGPVTRINERFKQTAGRLNQETLDRVNNAVTYRVYGREQDRDRSYEKILTEYERDAVRSNMWGSATTPIYNIIAMSGILFIIGFGGKNVLGTGWTVWDIGVFTTYVSCFTKFAQKVSSSARMFNNMQRALVSWRRIKPLFREYVELPVPHKELTVEKICAEKVTLSYPGYEPVLREISFEAAKGQIVGITGAVACGKTALAKTFIGDALYEGSIRLEESGRACRVSDGNEMCEGKVCPEEPGRACRVSRENETREGNIRRESRELRELSDVEKSGLIAYMGHEPELMSDSVRENILLGEKADTAQLLKMVHMDGEVSLMPGGEDTYVGSGGQQLSGGQQARISLARTLCHSRGIMILDDPFSSVDQKTEREIFGELKKMAENRIILLFSHRLALFPETDAVLYLHDGTGTFGTHEKLMEENAEYASLYQIQNSSQ
ncbi:MAG: ABC transporter ATP-binding protein/permease [Acetatifactor sp.]|nr:ABC transporter ATP-binding protein/permease [Acetatifactor sp.]